MGSKYLLEGQILLLFLLRVSRTVFLHRKIRIIRRKVVFRVLFLPLQVVVVVLVLEGCGEAKLCGLVLDIVPLNIFLLKKVNS